MLTYVATKNGGKLAEIRAIFAGSTLRLDTYPAYADVREGAQSYADNARLKARALRAQLLQSGSSGAAVLADDSGLEVSALGGRPGVLSARYAGEHATWAQRRAALLAELCAVPPPERAARFVCALVLCLPNGDEVEAFGTVEGRIAQMERGAGGFGYDPLFVFLPEGKTFAELCVERKNAISHRRRAAEALLRRLAGRV